VTHGNRPDQWPWMIWLLTLLFVTFIGFVGAGVHAGDVSACNRVACPHALSMLGAQSCWFVGGAGVGLALAGGAAGRRPRPTRRVMREWMLDALHRGLFEIFDQIRWVGPRVFVRPGSMGFIMGGPFATPQLSHIGARRDERALFLVSGYRSTGW